MLAEQSGLYIGLTTTMAGIGVTAVIASVAVYFKTAYAREESKSLRATLSAVTMERNELRHQDQVTSAKLEDALDQIEVLKELVTHRAELDDLEQTLLHRTERFDSMDKSHKEILDAVHSLGEVLGR